MILQFKKHLLSLLPNAHHKKFLLTVSAGVDSTVLMHLFQSCKLQYEVAHCNFQLRGKDSAADQEFVKNLCEKFNVSFHTKSFSLEQLHAKSIQNLARKVRYEWFNSLLIKNKLDYIVTAHHNDDNLETTLYRLAKGSGIKGISGIKPIHENRFRPLLTFSKENLTSYAKKNNITWREDTSNASEKYQRNFIRNIVVPQLATINSDIKGSFELTSKRLQISNEIFEQHLKNLREKYFIDQKNDIIIIKKQIFKQEIKSPVLLYELLLKEQFSFDTCQKLFEILDSTGKKFLNKNKSLALHVERDHVTLKKNIVLKKVQESITLKNQTITLGDHFLHLELIEVKDGFEFLKTSDYAYFDADQLEEPVTISSPKKGDAFIPFGMKGKQKLSDFFINNKYSAHQKSTALLLASNEQIVWLIGKRTSNLYKITPSTRNILKCHVQKVL